MMTELIHTYEHQYGVAIAELNAEMGRFRRYENGPDKITSSKTIDKLFSDCRDLIEQMDLEVRGINPLERPKFVNIVRGYESELNKLDAEFYSKMKQRSDRDELLGSGHDERDDEKAQLLSNTDRIERSGRVIDQGYKVAVETETVGAQILEDLGQQREALQRSRNRLKETDSALGKSSRVLSGMMRRIIQNRIILIVIAVVFVATISMVLYYAFKPNDSKT